MQRLDASDLLPFPIPFGGPNWERLRFRPASAECVRRGRHVREPGRPGSGLRTDLGCPGYQRGEYLVRSGRFLWATLLQVDSQRDKLLLRTCRFHGPQRELLLRSCRFPWAAARAPIKELTFSLAAAQAPIKELSFRRAAARAPIEELPFSGAAAKASIERFSFSWATALVPIKELALCLPAARAPLNELPLALEMSWDGRADLYNQGDQRPELLLKSCRSCWERHELLLRSCRFVEQQREENQGVED